MNRRHLRVVPFTTRELLRANAYLNYNFANPYGVLAYRNVELSQSMAELHLTGSCGRDQNSIELVRALTKPPVWCPEDGTVTPYPSAPLLYYSHATLNAGLYGDVRINASLFGYDDRCNSRWVFTTPDGVKLTVSAMVGRLLLTVFNVLDHYTDPLAGTLSVRSQCHKCESAWYLRADSMLKDLYPYVKSYTVTYQPTEYNDFIRNLVTKDEAVRNQTINQF